MNEELPSVATPPSTPSSVPSHFRLYTGLAGAIFVLILVVLGYLFGGGLIDRFDSTSFYWTAPSISNDTEVFSGDALVLVTKANSPDLPLLATVHFATRTITPLVDLTSAGTGVSSARLLPSNSRIAVTTLDSGGLSKVETTNAQGYPVNGDNADKGDTNSIRYNVDWSPTNQFIATGVLPTALLGTDKATDVSQWGTYVSSLFAPLKALIPGTFNPAFSSDGKSLFVLSADGVAAITVPENSLVAKNVASTTQIVATYPEGLKPAAMVFSEDRRTAVVTYLQSDRADVYAVSGYPAEFTSITTLTLPPVQVPFLGASSVAVSGTYLLQASQVSGGRVALTLETASTSQKMLKLPRDVARVSVVELIGGSVVESK